MTSNNITTAQAYIEPIYSNLKQLIEHGESPSAIILTLTIFTAVLLKSLKS
jgi:hypothetical protein